VIGGACGVLLGERLGLEDHDRSRWGRSPAWGRLPLPGRTKYGSYSSRPDSLWFLIRFGSRLKGAIWGTKRTTYASIHGQLFFHGTWCVSPRQQMSQTTAFASLHWATSFASQTNIAWANPLNTRAVCS
jgi:hypothetical protein